MQPRSLSPLDSVFHRWGEWTTNDVGLANAVAAAHILNQGKSVQVTFETVFTAIGTPLDHIRPLGMSEAFRQSLAAGVELLRLSDNDGQWILGCFPTRHAGVFHLVSGLPMTHPRWKKVERWINRASAVSRCFLDHDDFASIGDRLSEFGDVEVTRVAARVVRDGSSMNRGFPVRSDRLRPSHHEEIAEIESMGATVRTLTLSVSDTMHIHVRRVAGATFYSGDFPLFEDLVLSRLEDATALRRTLLTGRARESAATAVRPVSIRLPERLLVSREDTGMVLDVVRGMSDLSMTVFHRNPYLHFAVTDETEGSNFDVMVTHPDMIDIYPGFRATSTALGRLSQVLGERFGASRITDTPLSEPVSVYDLLNG